MERRNERQNAVYINFERMPVVAGSLLGVAIHREKYSFPVGKVYVKSF